MSVGTHSSAPHPEPAVLALNQKFGNQASRFVGGCDSFPCCALGARRVQKRYSSVCKSDIRSCASLTALANHRPPSPQPSVPTSLSIPNRPQWRLLAAEPAVLALNRGFGGQISRFDDEMFVWAGLLSGGRGP